MNINPIPNGQRPQRYESSGLRSLRDSDAVGRQWIKGQQDGRQVGALSQSVNHMQRQIDALRIRRVYDEPLFTLHPFRVYQSPLNPALTPAETYDQFWRTFRVRAGAYGTTAVGGTDEADANPDDPSLPEDKDYDGAIDFVVPDETAAYYVWVDASTPETPVIDHGTTIPGGGTDDDWWGGTYFLLAKIDTNTHTTNRAAIVRQYIRYDIPRCPA